MNDFSKKTERPLGHFRENDKRLVAKMLGYLGGVKKLKNANNPIVKLWERRDAIQSLCRNKLSGIMSFDAIFANIMQT